MPKLDRYTVALLHMNGSDASTTFTDETGKTWTRKGDAQIDTAQSKFGGASGLFDGTGDYITTPDDADFDFGNGNFTIDMWVRFNALPGAGAFASIYSQRTAYTNNHALSLEIYNESGTYKASIRWSTDGTTPLGTTSSGISLSTGGWYHFALVRNSADLVFYVNGESTFTQNISTNTIYNSTDVVAIGATKESSFGYFLNGWIDETRVSKGIARWTANFTPPIREYRESGLFTFHG